MEQIMQWVEMKIGMSPALQVQILETLVIVLMMVVVHRFVKNMLFKMIDNSKTYYRTNKASVYIFVIITLLLVSRIWLGGIESMTTFLGLLSAGLAIAMKDLVMNIAGWAYILWKGLFRVGDRIEIGDISGDVMDIQLFEFALMETRNWVKADQTTGRMVYIPNSFIFSKPLFNYSMGIPYIWDEVPIYVTYRSNWKKAKDILQDIANDYWKPIEAEAKQSIQRATKEFMVFNTNPVPTVYTSIDHKDSVILTVRYMCAYKNRRKSSEQIYEAVLEKFEDQPDIEFAYPTHRIYGAPLENESTSNSNKKEYNIDTH